VTVKLVDRVVTGCQKAGTPVFVGLGHAPAGGVGEDVVVGGGVEVPAGVVEAGVVDTGGVVGTVEGLGVALGVGSGAIAATQPCSQASDGRAARRSAQAAQIWSRLSG